ncbi:MAG TPA: peptidase inhibitor family I36 protein [Bryobacteraceae bacterium]|nr:peptidase inhibitor family I36 protein [Bryobacteraceae bacterium]
MHRFALLTVLFCGVFVAAAQDNPWVYRDNPHWDRSWNRRPFPRAGACFFTDRDFGGNRFCVVRGDRLERLPEDFGDNISSVRLFGGATVNVFNDRHFSGGATELVRSVRDLRRVPFRDGHTWNNRISSVIIR